MSRKMFEALLQLFHFILKTDTSKKCICVGRLEQESLTTVVLFVEVLLIPCI